MRENYSIRVFNQLAIKTTKALNVRVFYCLQGKSELTINLNKYELIKDEIAFVLLNDTYSFKSENDSICCVIDIPYDSYLRIANNSMLSNGLKINKNEQERVKFWIIKLLELHTLKKAYKTEANKLILYLIIELSHFENTDHPFNQKMYISEEVHEYLVNHHENKINKQDLANAVQLSNQTLTSMFKETPFQTFNQYLNHLRLKFCLNDILTTRRPIEEIAIDHGFHHYSRFIQLFKDTYGNTPKLIRRDYIATSIFQNKSEEIDLNRHILKSLSEFREETSLEIEERTIRVAESNNIYQSPDFYIEHINNNYFDQCSFLNMKRALNINKGNVHYIVDLNYKDIFKDRESFIKELLQLLQFISDLNMHPIFKVSTSRPDVFNSSEKMSFHQALEVLFIFLRQFNHFQLGFLIEEVKCGLIHQLQQSINKYFDDYQLIYRVKPGQYEELGLARIVNDVDKIMIPINLLEDLDIHQSKIIIEVDQLIKNKEKLLNIQTIDYIRLLMNQYDKVSGLSLPYLEKYVVVNIAQQEPNAFQLVSYVISMLNQLRGEIVYRNNQMVMTRYKHEYQVITYFLNIKSKMNVNQYRLIFSDIKQLNHAEVEYFDIQRYAISENNSLDNLMLYHQHHWLAKLNFKEISTSSIEIPKDSIAHIKFLISL